MVLGVVVVSFVKPMAFSRYFVVLLPAVVPVLAVQIGAFELNRFGRGCGLIVLALLMVSWWGPGFSELDAGVGGVREQDQFRLISQLHHGTSGSLQPQAATVQPQRSDGGGHGPDSLAFIPMGGKGDLKQRLQGQDLPKQLWLASSGPPPAMERKLKPLQSRVEQAGYRCEPQATDLTHARLLHCRSEAMGRSE